MSRGVTATIACSRDPPTHPMPRSIMANSQVDTSNNSSARVALITGCSEGGIGFHLCQELSRSGCIVYATARSVEKMSGLDECIHRLALDVNSDDRVADVVSNIMEREGRIDILVNNAGIDSVRPLLELPVSRVRATFETNVFSTIRLVQAVLPHMVPRSSGLVVNVSSIAAFSATPFSGAYSASKAALSSLTDTLDMELRPLGVRVLLLEPGIIKTRFNENLTSEEACVSETSLYRAFAPAIAARTRLVHQENAIAVDDFSRQVAAAILSRDPPRRLSIGGETTAAYILSWLPRSWRLDATWQYFTWAK